MNQHELLKHLVGHGYPAHVFCVMGVGTAANEGFVLEETAGPQGWRVVFHERGTFAFEQARFDSEAEACAYYLALMQKAEVVVWTTSAPSGAEALQQGLQAQGVFSRLQAVPAGVFGLPMIQLIVAAPDVERALRMVCHEPMRASR